jgi:hypothetical protein
MSDQNKHKRPKYTIQFKKNAAKLVNEKGYAHKQERSGSAVRQNRAAEYGTGLA